MSKGIFISFEGGEGCGKSTQSELLYKYLVLKNIPCLKTREPGGFQNENAEFIRSILVKGNSNWEHLTEVFLHNSARIEHLHKTVIPALNEGKVIISDRYIDSTLVYQGYGYGVNIEKIRKINELATDNVLPDITFIFDLDVELGLARASNRNSNEDKYERLGKKFHNKIRKGFLEICQENSNRCILLNADDTIENLHKNILSALKERFPNKFKSKL